MASSESMMIAAQCWCDEETKHKTMDSDLAIAFANRLDEKDKDIAQSTHGEIHKLAGVMRREFGDSIGRFVSVYATKINNDFNNKD